MRFIKLIVLLIVAGVSLGILGGLLGAIHPALDTLGVFRLHLSVGLGLLAVLFLLFRRFQYFLFAAVMAGIGIFFSLEGTILSAQNTPADSTKPVYKLVHFNLLYTNPEKSRAASSIRALNPDVLMLVEVSPKWDKVFAPLSVHLPYQLRCPQANGWGGLKLMSRFPINKAKSACHMWGVLGEVEATMPNGKNLTLASTHIRWPWPASGPKQIDALEETVQKLPDNVLLAGDFNSTTWSWGVKRFARFGDLDVVPGIGSTWLLRELPANWIKWAGLPIDNVMYKGDVNIVSAKTLEPLGSDHLPILVEFQMD